MSLRVAVASGNWSNPAIWNNGVVPTNGDIVASNTYTVTIDQDINIDTLTNAVASPQILTANMTSNTTPSGIVTASGDWYGAYPFWQAFQYSNNGDWLSSAPTGWIAYEFPTEKIVGKYTMKRSVNNGYPNSTPRDWTFEGWDGATWIILDTVTGNTTDYTANIPNTVAYIKYRLNITANNGHSYIGIQEIFFYGANDFGTNSTAGGGFILNNGVTVTCTNSVVGIIGNSATFDVVTYSGATSATINAKIGVNAGKYSVLHNGTGTLNIVGDVVGERIVVTRPGGAILVNSAGVLNLVGDFYPPLTDTSVVIGIFGGAVFNHTGNIMYVTASSYDRVPLVIGSASRYNLTGNVNGAMRSLTGTTNGTVIVTGSGTIVNITGSVTSVRGRVIESTQIMTLSIVGPIIANSSTDTANINPPVSDTQEGSLITFSGPFVCGAWGNMPFSVRRVSLIPSSSSYFQFPDNSTNAANTPLAPAPTTRLVSPGTAVDAPIPENVRQGVVYALGSQIGTLAVPSPNNVSYGVPTDNTVGTAVLTPQDVWNYARTNLTTPGSIGERLKNVSTVDTTGDQLTALL